MNRYTTAFDRLKTERRIAFIPFAVAGDPDIDTSEKVFAAYVNAGADILEIGYPFSDPVADGPINQRAGIRALDAGLTPQSFFSLIKRVRATTDIPFGLLLYANIVHHLGNERFCKLCAQSGIDSVLIADMPPEESGELLPILAHHGLQSVFIVSELTPDKRIKTICRAATGFIYVVSRLGTTGVQHDLNAGIFPLLKKIRRHTDLPLCVGFGLSEPAHIAGVARAGADGAIVGSRLVRIIEEQQADAARLMRKLKAALVPMRAATRKE
jgi:tryptophan synthase alpha chain